MSDTFFRMDGWVQTPTGDAVAGASVAVLDQPANFTGQPGSPLATIYFGPNSNTANVTAASWFAQQITFTLDAIPSDLVVDSYFSTVGITPSTYNSTAEAPWLVLAIDGLNVTVGSISNPGTYVSGGTIATSAAPNPLSTDGNGHYFFYTLPGLYSVQVYGSDIFEQDYPDQGIGTVAGGSVTSVALTMPAEFSVTGSPITGAGTFAVTKANQNANLVFAGPTTGSPAAPTFRTLVAADIPSLTFVSSVGFTLAVPAFLTQSVTGSPVTGSGTLAASIGLATQTANTFFAGPSTGAAAQPNFRAIVAADLPGAIFSTVSITLTSAQIKALNATPVQILAAQGANTVIVGFTTIFQYKFGATPYTVPTGANIIVGVLGGTDVTASSLINAAGLIDQSVSMVGQVIAQETVTQAADSNEPFYVANIDGAGEFTLGDGTLVVTFYYTVQTLS